jgi:hypothetical protein
MRELTAPLYSLCFCFCLFLCLCLCLCACVLVLCAECCVLCDECCVLFRFCGCAAVLCGRHATVAWRGGTQSSSFRVRVLACAACCCNIWVCVLVHAGACFSVSTFAFVSTRVFARLWTWVFAVGSHTLPPPLSVMADG